MLNLRFSSQAGRVEVSADSKSVASLRALRSCFVSSHSDHSQAFDVDLDDLLVNLQELARWPDDDVQWQPELLALVEGNVVDAEVINDRLKNRQRVGEHAEPVDLGTAWGASLTNFQQRDLANLLQLSHGANFSVPGAGKTRVSLAAFVARRRRGEVDRLLVVCPKSAFESWQFEAVECFPDAPLVVARHGEEGVLGADVLLVNYERLPDARPALIQWLQARPAMLILDEAHRMKLGPAGAWGAACLALGPHATARLILSGTPAPNGSKDLENLFSFVWPGQGRAAVTRAIAGNDLRTASKMLRPLFVRTTKSELQLPPVTTTVRRLKLPPLHRDLYDALRGEMSGRWSGDPSDVEALGRVLMYLMMAATTPALLAAGASPHEPLPYRVPPLQPPANSTLGELMRDLPHYEMSPKYREVLAIVAENAAAGRKTLVWSTFVRNLKSLERLLDRFQPSIVHGGSDDRPEQLQRFREDSDCMVLLSNPATLGEGISLHHVCHDAVYVDRDFAAGRFLQSLDRIHRLGLSPDVMTTITVLVANETIDELVEQRLAAKVHFLGTVLDDDAVLALADLDEAPSASAGMDVADIRALLEHLNVRAST
ncbi:DEAD/DEAH box helicase [Blastococcus sp. HT6-30]|uniref:DEAD/DEAH box helicase n=1 Tax=Blastococcus sp. HT6-30 TaxID=3144843 RepID=UPI00321AB093